MENDDEMQDGEWIDVKLKKKQKVCFKQDNSSDKQHVWRPRDEYREIPVVSYHNNGSTSDKQMEIDSTPEDSSPLSKPNFKNLIGKPVIIPEQRSKPLPSSVSMREHKGGLLHVNIHQFKDRDNYKQDDLEFDMTQETWPQMEGMDTVGDDDDTNTGIPHSTWSTIVRTAPKPRPLPNMKKIETRRKDETDTGKEEEDEEKMEDSKSKKKKKKQKLTQPLTLELGALIDALQTQSPKVKKQKGVHRSIITTGTIPVFDSPRPDTHQTRTESQTTPRNVLDSSAPVIRRGKERESPKKKKPSAIRKVIDKEKEERKRLQEEGQPIPSILDVIKPPEDTGLIPSAPTTCPPGLHNRRFREYCSHLVTPEIDSVVELLLTDLVRFQDRVYKNEPLKLKTKRRYVCGLREVNKHISLNRIKCVIFSPNLDRTKSPGGINHFVDSIMSSCNQQQVPVVFAMNRRRLAVVLKKKFNIGCVGVFNYSGAEDKYKKMIELVNTATRQYDRKRQHLLNPSGDKTSSGNSLLQSKTKKTQSEILIEESEEEEENDVDQSHIPTSEWGMLFGSDNITEISSTSQPTESIDSTIELKPVLQPIDSTTELKPVLQPIDSTTELKPVLQPIDSTTELKPVLQPIDSTTELKPVSQPMEYTQNISVGFSWNVSAPVFEPQFK